MTTKQLLTDTISTIEDTPVERPWVIYYKGKRVVVNSGKFTWRRRGHAVNAFHNNRKDRFISNLHYNLNYDWREAEDEYAKIFNELVESGELEFKQV